MEYNESQRQLWSRISHRNSTSIRRKKYHNQCLGREFALDVFAHLVHWFVEAFSFLSSYKGDRLLRNSGTQELHSFRRCDVRHDKPCRHVESNGEADWKYESRGIHQICWSDCRVVSPGFVAVDNIHFLLLQYEAYRKL